MKTYGITEIGAYQDLARRVIAEKLPVVLYGFHEAGEKACAAFRARDIPVVGILDVLQSKRIHEYEGIPVMAPEEYDYRVETVFVICSNRYFEEIRQLLAKRNCLNILPYYAAYFEIAFTYREFLPLCMIARRAESNARLEKAAREKEKLHVVDTLDLVITERCSLRCKECSNLMQYFHDPHDADMERTMAAVRNLLEAVDYIHEVRVLGGEPFVNQSWHRYVEYLLTFSKVGNVVVYTNGTIMPRQEQMAVFADPRAVLSISNYSGLSRKKDMLIDYMERNEYFYRCGDVMEWVRCGTIERRERTEEELKDVYHSCCVSGCLSLKNEKLFACPFSGNAYALQALPASVHEYVELLDTDRDRIREELEQLQRKQYLKACAYCRGRPIGFSDIPAAQQAPRPLDYQRFDAPAGE